MCLHGALHKGGLGHPHGGIGAAQCLHVTHQRITSMPLSLQAADIGQEPRVHSVHELPCKVCMLTRECGVTSSEICSVTEAVSKLDICSTDSYAGAKCEAECKAFVRGITQHTKMHSNW